MPDEAGEVAAPDTVVEAPATEAPSASTGEAVERAFQKVFGEDNAAETEAPQPVETGQPRAPDGKFAPKAAQETLAEPQEPQPAPEAPRVVEPPQDAPARFSPDAKAAWDSAPPAIRGEVRRAITELEGGLARYQERFGPVQQYAEMAERSGTTLKAALDNYVGMENLLRQDPVRGLEQVCQSMGTSLRDIAAQVMGQPAPEKDAVIGGLQAEIAALKQQFGGVQQTFQQQREAQTVQTVETFARTNPRFDELSGEIAALLKTGYATGLQDAYDKAARLNPAPAPAAPAAPAPAPQTRKSALSVNGAPSSGSNPANRQRSATTGDAISRAFEQVGLPTS